MNTISYNYENAKVFKRGRGFLGFTKTIMNDQSTSVKTAITQEFSDTYYQAAIKNVEKIHTPTAPFGHSPASPMPANAPQIDAV